MAGLADIMNQFAKPIDVSGISQNFSTGMSQGIQIASRKAELQQQQTELQFRRQQLEQQKMEHITGLMDKAVSQDDPVTRKVQLDYTQKVAGNMGYPIPDATIDYMNKSQEAQEKYLATLPSRNLSDPATKQQAARDGMGAWMGGPMKVMDYLNKATESQDKLNQAQALAGGKVQAEKERGNQDRITKLTPYLTSVDDAKVLQNGVSDPRFLDVYGKASVLEAQDAEKKRNLQNDNTAADAAHKAAETKAIPIHLNQEQQRIGIDKTRVALQTGKETQNIFDKIQTDTAKDRDRLTELNAVDNIFKKGATVNQVNAGAQALEKSLTGSARVAATTYNGIKLEDAYANIKKTMAKWGVGKVDDAVVPEPILNNYKQISAAIKKAVSANVTSTAAVHLQGGVKNGLVDTAGARSYLDSINDPKARQKFFDKIGYKDPTAAPPQPAAGAAKLKAPSPAFMDALSKQLPDAAARKAFLDSKGFDSTGVQ